MSNFVGKTVGTLSTLFGNVGLADNNVTKKEKNVFWFYEKSTFIQKVKSATSENEKDDIISSFLTSAEKHLSQPKVTEAEVENCVKLALVCESLGYPAPFIYVHAIKLAQKGNLQQKHTGYLAAAALLHPEHELVILLINTIQKDLESSNYAEILLGLKAICNLICADTVHNVMYLVGERLNHERSEVRELAALTLGHCLKLTASESAYRVLMPKLEKHLCDSSLAFVATIVKLMHHIVKIYPGDYDYLIGSLVHLQNQLLQRRIPREMEYKTIPAPWLQISVISFLGLLCTNAEQSQQIYPILKLTLQKAEINHNMTYAIIFACIEAIVSIQHNDEMIQLALASASKLLISPNKNLKYIGVEAFTMVVKCQKPVLSPSVQENIMECLNHFDETLKYKTLELLVFLANPSNVEAVCSKLIKFLSSKISEDLKKELSIKVIEIASKYKKDNHWFMSTITDVLLQSDVFLPPENISGIMDIILNDTAIKECAKRMYSDLCVNNCPPSSIIIILTSILNEPLEFEICLPKVIENANETSCMWIMVAFRNAILKHKTFPQSLCLTLKSTIFTSMVLQQIQSEILQLIDVLESIPKISLSEEVDPTLTFLDDYVYQALLNGSPCYQSERLRSVELGVKVPTKVDNSLSGNSATSLFCDPESKSLHDSPSAKSFSYTSISSSSFHNSTNLTQSDSHSMYCPPKIKNVWTGKGRIAECEESNQNVEQSNKEVKELLESNVLFAGVS